MANTNIVVRAVRWGGACGVKEGVVLHCCTVSCHIHQPISLEDGEKFIHQRLWAFRVDLIQQTVVGDQSSTLLRQTPPRTPSSGTGSPPSDALLFFSAQMSRSPLRRLSPPWKPKLRIPAHTHTHPTNTPVGENDASCSATSTLVTPTIDLTSRCLHFTTINPPET